MTPSRIAVAALALTAAPALHAADPALGRALYEARCGGCHNESVHNDSSRKARSFEQVRARVAEFGDRLDAGWSGPQVDAVAVHLNERYYAFPCPRALCPGAPRR